jgi:hypothetical protein
MLHCGTGAKEPVMSGSWVIPEVSEDYVSWQEYEREFRELAGAEHNYGAGDRMEVHWDTPHSGGQALQSCVQSWDFLRPCTIAELGAGGNMAAAMAIAIASRAPRLLSQT